MKVCLKINIPARYLKVPNNMFPVSKSLDCEFHGNLEAAFQLYFHTTNQLPRETSTVWHLELLNFYINIFRKLLRYGIFLVESPAPGSWRKLVYNTWLCMLHHLPSSSRALSSCQVTNIENILCTGSLLKITLAFHYHNHLYSFTKISL